MKEMNEKELLYAILKNQEAANAKITAIEDQIHSFQRETNSNFNRLERSIKFLQVDYDQLNERIEKLEKTPSN